MSETPAIVALALEGMDAPGSSVLAEDVVESLPGVKSCRADARRGRAVVTYDPNEVTPEQMVAALADAGYRAAPEPEPDAAAAPAGSEPPQAPDATQAHGVGRPPPPAAVAALRRSRRVLWAAVAVAVPVTLLVAALATRPPAATRAVRSPLVGKPAPEVSGTTVDGEPFRLPARPGRWVLVNFFATWCVPCRTEHPELVRFDEAHRRSGDAGVVSVVYDDSEAAVREFRQREGGSWPMVVDPKGRIALDFGVAGVPESYLVSPAGVVAAKVIGGVRAADLERLLDEAKQART